MRRDEILTILRERILAFATSRVQKDLAEDLTQEVLILLHEKYGRVTELTELVPLAFQVLRFKMLDTHRKSLRRGEYNQNSVEDLPVATDASHRTLTLPLFGDLTDDEQDHVVAALARIVRFYAR